MGGRSQIPWLDAQVRLYLEIQATWRPCRGDDDCDAVENKWKRLGSCSRWNFHHACFLFADDLQVIVEQTALLCCLIRLRCIQQQKEVAFTDNFRLSTCLRALFSGGEVKFRVTS